jgi:hypothetical protein
MHEINAAAEAITTAADPDANIIFGATINPELDGEVIITVVATGFDASYFTNRRPVPSTTLNEEEKLVTTSEKATNHSVATDQDMSTIDTTLPDEADAPKNEFTDDTPMPNIWTIHENGDKKPDDEEEQSSGYPFVSHVEEDELERPSFLRRLANKRRKDDQKDTEDTKEESEEHK